MRLTYNSHASCTKCACDSHVLHIQYTCDSHVNAPHEAKAGNLDVRVEDLNFRAVMHHTSKYLSPFIQHHLERLPCMEGVVISAESMQQAGWRKEGARKTVAKLAPHRFLPGLNKGWANQAVDFCISMNLLPLIFSSSVDPDERVDMVTPFILGFWPCYQNLTGSEAHVDSDEAQMVRRLTCNMHATNM